MKKQVLIFLFLIFLALLTASPYNSNETVISSGGNNISSSNYKTDVSISQISGNTNDGNYITGLGFFYAILNNIPLFITIPDKTWNQDTNTTINLSTYTSDIDNDELTYTSTTPANIGVSINTGIATLTPSSGFSGNCYIVFYADDGVDITNSNNVSLSVTQVTEEAPLRGGGPSAPEEVKDFSVNRDLIKLLLKQGGDKSELLIVKNIGDVKLEFVVDVSEISDFVIVDEYAFELASGEEKTLKFDFYASEIKAPDVYTGRIKITSEGIEKIINTIIEVLQKEALFDINLIIFPETKEVKPGEIVKANLTMINLGDLQDIDVELELIIKNMQGEIIDSKHETLAVLGKGINITRNFKLSKKIKPGDYVLYTKLTYNKSIATASDIFKVIEGEKPSKLVTGICWIILGILLVLIILIYFIIRKYIKIREERKISNLLKAKELYNAAKNLYQEKDYDSALKKFQESVKMDNKFWQGYEGMGNCYFAKGEVRKAISAYEKSLLINPKNIKLAQWLEKYKKTK